MPMRKPAKLTTGIQANVIPDNPAIGAPLGSLELEAAERAQFLTTLPQIPLKSVDGRIERVFQSHILNYRLQLFGGRVRVDEDGHKVTTETKYAQFVNGQYRIDPTQLTAEEYDYLVGKLDSAKSNGKLFWDAVKRSQEVAQKVEESLVSSVLANPQAAARLKKLLSQGDEFQVSRPKE